nr:unnamed protein product [Naegleria fowleri]
MATKRKNNVPSYHEKKQKPNDLHDYLSSHDDISSQHSCCVLSQLPSEIFVELFEYLNGYFLEQHKDYEFSREILFKKEEQDDLDEYHFEFYKMLRYHPEFMTIHYVNAMIPDRAGWNGYNDFIILKNEKDYAIDERAFIERDHGFTSCSNKKTIHQKRKV